MINMQLDLLLEAMNFEELKLNKYLLQAVEALGYEKPTPIQQVFLPYWLGKMCLV